MTSNPEPRTHGAFDPGAALPGRWVEVRSGPEILATLDAKGALEGLPFMPEMLPFCGKRFRVQQCAERACVYPPKMPFRRVEGCLVLEGLRCDGAAHGGCQLGCMFFWKEAWLKPADGPHTEAPAPEPAPEKALRVHQDADGSLYCCQATELPRATGEGDPIWKPGQYVRFVRRGTLTVRSLLGMFWLMGLRKSGKILRSVFRGKGPLKSADPAPLGLRPGQWVKVKSREEIQRTLDASGRHKGLPFSGEMSEFCGRRLKVKVRVDRIIDESTGRMRQIKDTVILESAVCDRYLGCARGMPLLWREAWLELQP
jgi:hypothetical protein